jgi:alpha-L-fucosidase
MIIPKNDGTASVEVFFTTKGKTLYCILPWFPSNGFTLKNYTLAPGAKISLVGYSVPVTGLQKGKDVQITVPALNPLEISPSGIYVLKVE